MVFEEVRAKQRKERAGKKSRRKINEMQKKNA
jgi:hypothetical protein